MIWSDWETAIEWLQARGYKDVEQPHPNSKYSYCSLENEHQLMLFEMEYLVYGVINVNFKR